MKDIVEIAQILTGVAAIVSLFFTAYAYRHQKYQEQLQVALNVSTWIKDAKDTNNPLKAYKILANNNPFPVYNVIWVLVPNDSNFSLEKTLKSSHEYFEIVAPGKKVKPFTNSHSAGNGHRVPELYFTDNQNTEWHRDKRGILKKTSYLRKAIKLGIVLKHV
ncbi:hypothetical protein [Lentilactobacillus parabuchneri]|uniref:hypothetical protein n=1 Tax=Lentilactobacillus parabuchneri TaxID=152331 RepID=UPI002307A0F8|nr:hypothetical protein [Lentilactobacillus parabuchneri]MDB1104786.1 hypothetical protein [Lentilactobacillus parabuchneri]